MNPEKMLTTFSLRRIDAVDSVIAIPLGIMSEVRKSAVVRKSKVLTNQ